jgi:hypothetical protein
MPEALDGQASASDFDFYEDSDSIHPVAATPVSSTSTTLSHPRLQQLRGTQKMPSPALVVAGS